MSGQDQKQMLEEAMRMHQQGRLDDARSRYKALLADDPENDKAMFLLANLDAAAGRYEQACESFAMAAALDPTIVEYQVALGEVFGRLGRVQEAAQVLRDALKLAPGNPDIHNNLGIALASQHEFEKAAPHFAKVIEIQPDAIMAHHHYAACLNESGQTSEAVAALERLLVERPDDVQALNNLGATYLNQGDDSKAAEYLEKAVRVDRAYAPARVKLALALQNLGRLDDALDQAQRGVGLAPEQAPAHAGLGSIYLAMGQHDAALKCFMHAVELNPDLSTAISGLAECYRLRGELDKARDLLLPMTTHETPATEIATGWAKVMLAQRTPEEGIPVLERAMQSHQISRTGRVQLGFALGQLLDQRGDYDSAWRELEAANGLKGSDFDRREHRDAVDTMIHCFSADALQSLPRSNCESEVPVFIVGMPRVGKTIVEQIVSSHPDVYGAGELPVVGLLSACIKRLTKASHPYPLNIASLNEKFLDRFARDYLEQLTRKSGDAIRVSDTMPMNFYHIGFIELMFPKARVIHCTRDTADTLFACLSKNFRDPLINFSCSVEDVISYYADYKKLMDHFRKVSSLTWLDVNYEELVRETDVQSRKLIEFLGLEWHADCDKYFAEGIAKMSGPERIRSQLDERDIGFAKHYPPLLRALESLAI